MFKLFYSREFLLFLACGGTAAGVNFISRILLNAWISFSAAVVVAYLVGMVVAFILNRCFVFEVGEQSITRSIFYFTLVNIVGLAQTWLISMGLNYYVFPYFGYDFYSRETAHGIGIMVPAFSSYVGHKFLSFR